LKVRLIALSLVVLIIVSGCAWDGFGEDELPTEEDSSDDEKVADKVQYPLTITDSKGRQIIVENKPERIISFEPGLTDTLLSLNLEEKIVGIDDYSSYSESMTQVQRVGGPIDPDIESIISLEPDIFLVGAGMENIEDDLADEGMQVITLESETYDDLLRNIRLTGKVTGELERAEEVISTIEEQQQNIAETVGEIEVTDRPVVLYEMWANPLMTEGSGTLVDFIIETAGGINAARDYEGSWVELDIEELKEINPEVIITSYSDSISELKRGKRPEWEGLTAVSREQFYLVDAEIIGRRGPRVTEGFEAVARLLHPHLFEE